MAILSQIRSRAGVLIVIIIGLALFSFILSDFLGLGKFGGRKNDYTVAEVGGKSVSLMEFQQKVDHQLKLQELFSGRSTQDEENTQKIREQTWEQLIREYVLQKEYSRLGIEVNADEVMDMIQGKNVHPYIRQLFSDPKTGQFNQAYVIQFLKSMDQDETGKRRMYWLNLENDLVNERRFSKYINLISKGLYVTDSFTKENENEIDKIFNISYIFQPYSLISDSDVQVSTKELKAYYKENKESYKQEPSRDMEYIIFQIVPSADDDKLIHDWIDKIYNEFASTTSDREFVNVNSDKSFEDKNYRKDELSDTLKEFMFKAKIGDLFGPYFEDGTYKIAKLSEINYLPDSVKTRHILIQATAQTDDADKLAHAKADSIKEVLKKNPSSFADLCKQFSVDQGSADKGGDLGWFQEGKMVKPFSDSCFDGKIGKLMIAKSQFGYHIIEVLEKSPNIKKVKVAVLERKVIPSNNTVQFYYSKANEFAGKNNTYQKFTSGAEQMGIAKRIANNIGQNDRQVPGISSAREMVRWAYGAKLHETSPIFELDNKFVIAILTKVVDDKYASFEDKQQLITVEVKKQKKAEKLVTRMKEQLASASSIQQLAGNLQTDVKQANDLKFVSTTLPGYIIEPKVIAAASVLENNKISQPIIGNNGVYIVVVNSFSQMPIPGGLEQLKANLMRRNASIANQEAYEILKELANIKDLRHKFF